MDIYFYSLLNFLVNFYDYCRFNLDAVYCVLLIFVLFAEKNMYFPVDKLFYFKIFSSTWR